MTTDTYFSEIFLDDHLEHDLFHEFMNIYGEEDLLFGEQILPSADDQDSLASTSASLASPSTSNSASECPSEASSPSISSISSPLSSSTHEDSSACNGGRTSTGRYLNLGDRLRIRDLVIQHKLTKSEVARQFQISLNSVKYILSVRCTDNDNIRAQNGMDLTATRSNLSDKKRTALDTYLCNWVKQQEEEHAALNKVIIETEAIRFMKEVQGVDFTPGKKWYQNFRKRCGIRVEETPVSLLKPSSSQDSCIDEQPQVSNKKRKLTALSCPQWTEDDAELGMMMSAHHNKTFLFPDAVRYQHPDSPLMMYHHQLPNMVPSFYKVNQMNNQSYLPTDFNMNNLQFC